MKKLSTLVLAVIFVFSIVSCNQSQVNDDTKSDVSDTTQNSSQVDNQSQVNNTTQNSSQVDNLSEYLIKDKDNQYLILPISKSKVYIRDKYNKYLNNIDIELLKTAEETINAKISAHPDTSGGFYLGVDDAGYLCLRTECIVDIDPPNIITAKDGTIIDGGCDVDHKHLFYSERITKQKLTDFNIPNSQKDMKDLILSCLFCVILLNC